MTKSRYSISAPVMDSDIAELKPLFAWCVRSPRGDRGIRLVRAAVLPDLRSQSAGMPPQAAEGSLRKNADVALTVGVEAAF